MSLPPNTKGPTLYILSLNIKSIQWKLGQDFIVKLKLPTLEQELYPTLSKKHTEDPISCSNTVSFSITVKKKDLIEYLKQLEFQVLNHMKTLVGSCHWTDLDFKRVDHKLQIYSHKSKKIMGQLWIKVELAPAAIPVPKRTEHPIKIPFVEESRPVSKSVSKPSSDPVLHAVSDPIVHSASDPVSQAAEKETYAETERWAELLKDDLNVSRDELEDLALSETQEELKQDDIVLDVLDDLQQQALALQLEMEQSLNDTERLLAQLSLKQGYSEAKERFSEQKDHFYVEDPLLDDILDPLLDLSGSLDNFSDLSELPQDDLVIELLNPKKEEISIPKHIQSQTRDVYAIEFVFKLLELSDKADILWIETRIPGLSMPEPHDRFRTKTGGKRNVKLQHSFKIPLEFDDQLILEWQKKSIEFKITALGLNRMRKLEEIWTGTCSVGCAQLWGSSQLQADCMIKSKSKLEGSLMLDITLLSQESKPEPVKEPTKEHTMSFPSYLYFRLGKTRSLLLPEPTESNLLFMRIRLFSASHLAIETPPIKHDPITNDFDFSYTTPLPMTPEFMNAEAPIIVEVYCLAKSSDGPKEKLLGLARLPFDQLMKAFTSASLTGNYPSGLQIPECEYCIKDPFSGTASGWVEGYLSLGAWEYIDEARKRFLKHSVLPSPNDLKELVRADRTQEIAEELKQLQTEVAGKETRESRKQESLEPVTKQAHQDNEEREGETTIGVQIARACGLLGLLEDYLEQETDDRIIQSLEYSMDQGLNTFVRLCLFPGSVYEAIVESDISESSFVPDYDFEAQVCVSGFDTQLIRLIKSGKAKGQLWHKSTPGNVFSLSKPVLLGEFEIPLESLLKQGITQQWIPIFAHKSQTSNALVQLSMHFQSGIEQPLMRSVGLFDHLELLLHLSQLETELPTVFCKFQVPGEDRWEYTPTFPSSSFQYQQTVEMKLSASLMAALEEPTELQFWSQVEDADMPLYLGSIYLDLSSLLEKTRLQQRNKRQEKPKVNQKMRIINPNSAHLGKHFVLMEASLNLSRTPSVRKPIQKQTEKIRIKVKIERCMNLPLVQDRLVLSNPFVKSQDQRTVLPNVCVSFDTRLVPDMDSQTIQTPVLPGQINPVWNFEHYMDFPKSKESIDTLKRQGKMHLKVWHVDGEKKLLGTVEISFDPLFSGLYEIYGWYPVLDSHGSTIAQMMVQIHPEQHLASLTSKKREVVVEKPMLSNSDTWVWNGTKWEHRQVEQFRKSMSEAIQELDKLQVEMTQKLNRISPEPLKALKSSTDSEPVVEAKMLLSDLEPECQEVLDRSDPQPVEQFGVADDSGSSVDSHQHLLKADQEPIEEKSSSPHRELENLQMIPQPTASKLESTEPDESGIVFDKEAYEPIETQKLFESSKSSSASELSPDQALLDTALGWQPLVDSFQQLDVQQNLTHQDVTALLHGEIESELDDAKLDGGETLDVRRSFGEVDFRPSLNEEKLDAQVIEKAFAVDDFGVEENWADFEQLETEHKEDEFTDLALERTDVKPPLFKRFRDPKPTRTHPDLEKRLLNVSKETTGRIADIFKQ
ncbi:hypothetical protein EDD86DRAFT_197398 [Gorgonomyces haynaldii]|nr:hypothetical protein EDD86DRAFT_197398 [Gorgonomyces haynaldii]